MTTFEIIAIVLLYELTTWPVRSLAAWTYRSIRTRAARVHTPGAGLGKP